MGLFSEYRRLIAEAVGEHHPFPGTDYSARIVPTKGGMHIAKFFKNGEHMTDADYGPYDYDDVRGFVDDEKEVRTKEAKKAEVGKSKFKVSVPDQDITDVEDMTLNKKTNVVENKNPPQGKLHITHEISKDSKEGDGRKVDSMSRTRKSSLEVIANILSRA
jgi:hypothetical protein